jgi:hypothetical protein
MKTRKFTVLIWALGLAIFGGISSAGAGQPFNYSDQSHMYCPPGATMYFGLFGYWCEDSTMFGVEPTDCKSGSGQLKGTWNNGARTPDQLCTANGGMSEKPATTN